MTELNTHQTEVTTLPVVARTRGELARGLAALRAASPAPTVALVPTMGALHDGHRALIARARELADVVVVSVFVNPLQFGPDEDLDRYPRPWESDLAILTEDGVDLVFAPSEQVMYPDGARVTVSAGAMGTVLEGAFRPGHFDGVLTVVAKLFHLIGPDLAVFGEKDAQQLALIRRMVSDLDFPVHIVGVETVRESDGLARSSRNVYLSPDERSAALALSRGLFAGRDAAARGPRAVLEAAHAEIDPAVDSVDYVAFVDPATLEAPAEDFSGTALLLTAARVGSTRLIDNVQVEMGGTR